MGLALAAAFVLLSASGTPPDTVSTPSVWTTQTVEIGSGWGPGQTLVDVRAGSHEAFDRVVFEFGGDVVPHALVEYAAGPVAHCASGETVAGAGLPYLQVTFLSALAHTEAGEPTLPFRRLEPFLPIVQTLEDVCDFEGIVQWVALLDHRRAFRVFTLREPARLVVDVAR